MSMGATVRVWEVLFDTRSRFIAVAPIRAEDGTLTVCPVGSRDTIEEAAALARQTRRESQPPRGSRWDVAAVRDTRCRTKIDVS